MDRVVIKDFVYRDIFLKYNILFGRNIINKMEVKIIMKNVGKIECISVLENILLLSSFSRGVLNYDLSRSKHFKQGGSNIVLSILYKAGSIFEVYRFYLICIEFIAKKKLGNYFEKRGKNLLFLGSFDDKGLVLKNIYYLRFFGNIEFYIYFNTSIKKNKEKIVFSYLQKSFRLV